MRHVGKQFMLRTCLNKLTYNKMHLKKENHCKWLKSKLWKFWHDIQNPEPDREDFYDNNWSRTSFYERYQAHIQEVKEEPFITVPRIDFVFGDQQWKLRDCELNMRIQHTKYPKIRSHIQTKSGHQRTWCGKPISSWRKRL